MLFELVDGGYTGEVVVEIDVPGGGPGSTSGPNAVVSYDCELKSTSPSGPPRSLYHLAWLAERNTLVAFDPDAAYVTSTGTRPID